MVREKVRRRMVRKKDDGENKEDGDVVCRRVREVVRRMDPGLSHRLSVRPSLVLEAGCHAEYHYLLFLNVGRGANWSQSL